MIARKRASRQSPNASVSTPSTTRIRLKKVKTLATTMLRVDRLVAGTGGGPRSASRARASASVRPAGGASARAGSVSVRRPRLHPGPAASALSGEYVDEPDARKASQERTQGAPICGHIGATEDAAWRRLAAA